MFEMWKQWTMETEPASSETPGPSMICKNCGKKYYGTQFNNITQCECGSNKWDQFKLN